MNIAWADALPDGVTVDAERDLLARFGEIAPQAGLRVVGEPDLDPEVAEYVDLVLEGEEGCLLFAVRRKGANARSRIDVDSRPTLTYRTRHVMLEKGDGTPWIVVNDSDTVEPLGIETAEGLRSLASRMLAVR